MSKEPLFFCYVAITPTLNMNSANGLYHNCLPQHFYQVETGSFFVNSSSLDYFQGDIFKVTQITMICNRKRQEVHTFFKQMFGILLVK